MAQQQEGKVVRISDEVYTTVAAAARYGETFDAALRRLLRMPAKKAKLRPAGAGKR